MWAAPASADGIQSCARFDNDAEFIHVGEAPCAPTAVHLDQVTDSSIEVTSRPNDADHRFIRHSQRTAEDRPDLPLLVRALAARD